jgi:hypothetical protein
VPPQADHVVLHPVAIFHRVPQKGLSTPSAVGLNRPGHRVYVTLPRSNSHAAKHRMWTWNLSSPGLSPSRANWISNSI